jgi:probable rRNA maturation factor
MPVRVLGEKKAKVSAAMVREAAGAALSFLSREGSGMAVVFVDDKKIGRLNKVYRGKSGPTDILSFASGDDDDLGDIFISPASAVRKAEKRSMPYRDYLKLLIVHGTLHLAGFDHHEPAAATLMEKKEKAIIRKLHVELQ